MKLQNILDLSTFEITRFRIWNQTSQPSDKGLGSKYFNTNSGHEAYGREQIYTPIGWRTAAYMDDIDSINEKLDLIFGDEIDTDTIIDSWKEVQDFLAGIEDTTTLMTMLDDKLSKSKGGVITSSDINVLYLNSTSSYNTSALVLQSNGTNKAYVGVNDTNGAFIYNYAANSYIGVKPDGTPHYNGAYTLVHSGNVGDYALKYQGISLPDNIKSGFGYNSEPNGYPHTGGFATFGNGVYGFQIMGYASHAKLSARGLSNGSFSDWKTIAFTDSDITGYAAGLKHSNGKVGVTVGDSGQLCISPLGIFNDDGTLSLFDFGGTVLNIGYSMRNAYPTDIYGNAIRFRVGNNIKMLINSSGNVTIGGSDSGTGARLYVDGDVGFSGLANLNGGALIPTGKNMMFGDASGNAIMEYDEDAGAIKITGSVYATGTVASGGKAQAGSGTGGSAQVYTFSLTYGKAAYQIANPKSNTNVIVQVYEWNSTTSSWDLILTDVNVTASKITVTFGRTTTVNHMVTVV